MTHLLRLSAALHYHHHHLAGNLHLPNPIPNLSSPAAISIFSSSCSLRPISISTPSLSLLRTRSTSPAATDLGGGGNDNGGSGGGWRSSGGGGGSDDHDHRSDRPSDPLNLFLEGWRSRVAADPEFGFKVLMEELVGVTACVLGDMASRPNFGLNELDFVFSTLVVGSILNFVLMYLLAPTSTSTSSLLPGLFSTCPPSHMFEPGSYSFLERAGTAIYKGTTFAVVGFFAGLAGTAISNGLMAMRKKMDPAFETPNKPPPTVLNALTWAIHMGVSSNLRYQTLNGVEFLLARALPPAGFKTSVVVMRCLNNVLGGVSFVVLARLTGSQKVQGEEGKNVVAAEEEVKEKLIGSGVAAENGDGGLRRSEAAQGLASSSK